MNTLLKNHIVRYSEADRNGLLKLRSLFDYFQDIAGEHASLLNLSMEQLHEQNKAWMLSRIKLKINRLPAIKEKFELHTYPRGFERFFARREFRIYDENRQLLVAASSLWLYVELSDLSILNAKKHLTNHMPDNSTLDCAFEELNKINPDSKELFQKYHIGESRLDINQHLNNAEYAAFIQDFLGKDCYPEDLQINYQHGVTANSKLEIYGKKEEKNFELAGILQEQTAFAAEGTIK